MPKTTKKEADLTPEVWKMSWSKVLAAGIVIDLGHCGAACAIGCPLCVASSKMWLL